MYHDTKLKCSFSTAHRVGLSCRIRLALSCNDVCFSATAVFGTISWRIQIALRLNKIRNRAGMNASSHLPNGMSVFWYEQQCFSADRQELSQNTYIHPHTRKETPKACHSVEWNMWENVNAVTFPNQENGFRQKVEFHMDKVTVTMRNGFQTNLCTKVIMGFPIQLCRARNLI
jgi:hypothetical protein